MASDTREALRRIGTCSLCRGPVMRHETGGASGRRILESVERGLSGGGGGVGGRRGGGRVVIRCAWCGATPADADGAEAMDIIEMRPCADALRDGTDETRRIESGAGGGAGGDGGAHLGNLIDATG